MLVQYLLSYKIQYAGYRGKIKHFESLHIDRDLRAFGLNPDQAKTPTD